MSKAASASALDKERSSTSEAEASARSRLIPIVAEILLIGAPALIVITVISAMLASRQLFLGYFGDSEQFLWQVDNLKQVLGGDATVTRAFFGEPEPYAYHHVVMLVAVSTLITSELSGNPFFAANFMLLGFLVLNFCSMYAVLRMLNFAVLVSLLFGAVFLFAPVTLAHALGHLSLTVTFLLPPYFYVLYRIKLQPQSLTLWVACGLITGAYVWVREELGLYIVVVSGIFLVMNARAVLERRLAVHVGLWLAIVALFVLPVLALYMHRWDFDRDHGIATTRDVREAQLYSASPANYLFPSDENFIYHELPVAFDHANLTEHLNYLGVVNLAGLAVWLYMLVLRRDLLEGLLRGAPFLRTLRWELTLIAIVSFIVSLGPLLELNQSTVRLPLYVGYYFDLPAVEQIRAWGRFGIFTFAPITFLSAHVVRFLLTKHQARAFLALLAVPALVVAVADQYPVATIVRHKLEVPPAVQEIKAAEGDPFVLNLPLNLYSGAIHNSTALFLQLYHDKRIVNGYAPFVHPLLEKRVLTSPLLCFSYPQMLTTNPDSQCSTPEIAGFFTDEDIRYIIYEKITWAYYPGFGQPEDAKLREKSVVILNDLISAGAFAPFYEDNAYVFYRRTAQPP